MARQRVVSQERQDSRIQVSREEEIYCVEIDPHGAGGLGGTIHPGVAPAEGAVEFQTEDFFLYLNFLRQGYGFQDALSSETLRKFQARFALAFLKPELQAGGEDEADSFDNNSSYAVSSDFIEEEDEPPPVPPRRTPVVEPVAGGVIHRYSPIFSEIRFFYLNKDFRRDDPSSADKGALSVLNQLLKESLTQQVFYVCESDDPCREIFKQVFNTVSMQPSARRNGINLELLHTPAVEGQEKVKELLHGASARPSSRRSR